MNETYPHPQHNSGDGSPDGQPRLSHKERFSSSESDVRRERHLSWAVSEALLRAVYEAVGHAEQVRAAAAEVALEQVQRTHMFNMADEAERDAQLALATYLADQIVELANAYDDLTTSDMQGVVEALAWRLASNELPIPGANANAASEDVG